MVKLDGFFVCVCTHCAPIARKQAVHDTTGLPPLQSSIKHYAMVRFATRFVQYYIIIIF